MAQIGNRASPPQSVLGWGLNSSLITSETRLLADAARHHEAGSVQQAESIYWKILKLDPSCASARHRLGIIAFLEGRIGDAIKLIDDAVVLEPGNALFHMSLGTMLRHKDRFKEAEAVCHRAIELEPSNAEAHNILGNVLKDRGALKEALAAYESVLVLQPDHIMATLNLAALHRQNGEMNVAFDSLAAINSIAGGVAAYQNEMGLTHLFVGQPYEAGQFFKAALSVDPTNSDYLNNLGLSLRDRGRLNEAIAAYNLAVELSPQGGEARWNRSIAHLMMNNWEKGLSDWQWRHHHSAFQERSLPQPLWTGCKLREGSLLIHSEHDVSDEIFYAGLIPLVQNKTSNIILETGSLLEKLVQRSYPEIKVIAKSQANYPWRYAGDLTARIPSPDLVTLIGGTQPSEAIPPAYLKSDQKKTTEFRRWLEQLGQGPYIGVSWKYNTKYSSRERSVPLVNWSSILKNSDFKFINLLSGEMGNEIAEAKAAHGTTIESHPDLQRLNDLDDLAAMINALDAVVTAPSVTAMLAGALGVDTRIMVDTSSSWYLGAQGSKIQFFPSVTAYRQNAGGDWTDALNAIGLELNELVL